jgi:hypothetical protein
LKCPKLKNTLFRRGEGRDEQKPALENTPRKQSKAVFISVGFSLLSVVTILLIFFVYIPRNDEANKPLEIAGREPTEEEVLKSFKLFLRAEKKRGLLQKKDDVYYIGSGYYRWGGWFRIYYGKPKKIKYSIERTSSLESPYIGTVKFDTDCFQTRWYETEEEARNSEEAGNVHRDTYIYTYIYQDNKWILTDKYEERIRSKEDLLEKNAGVNHNPHWKKDY